MPNFKIIQPEEIYSTPSYVHAIRAGNTLYVAGQVAKDKHGVLVSPNDAVGQAHQVFRNLATVLVAAGASFGNVVKITTYMVDRADAEAIRTIRYEYFGDHRPPHTGLFVNGFGDPAMKLEVEVIAVLDE